MNREGKICRTREARILNDERKNELRVHVGCKKKRKKREKQVKLIKRSCEDTQRESHMIVSNITRYNEVSN